MESLTNLVSRDDNDEFKGQKCIFFFVKKVLEVATNHNH